MLTGRHLVRDVFCKNCLTKLGWQYEFAHDAEQCYKEGHFILERKLLKEDLVQDPNLAERVHVHVHGNNNNQQQQQQQLTRASSVSSVSSGLSSSVTIS